jgi:hypothetical protein
MRWKGMYVVLDLAGWVGPVRGRVPTVSSDLRVAEASGYDAEICSVWSVKLRTRTAFSAFQVRDGWGYDALEDHDLLHSCPVVVAS